MIEQFGNYRVEALIADGGMGQIYAARHILLDRRAAIKVLHEHYAGDPQFRTRFLHEARAMAALDHPNIVRLYDFGEEDQRFYLVMELIEGGTVQTLLRDAEGELLDLRLTVSLLRQAALGLSYAHAQGMIHRDVKPGNLLLDISGERGLYDASVLKIADFGLVRLADSAIVTATGLTLGTAAYMSPEQCTGHDLDHRSDIYSLGVVLFELLTGRLPFSGDSSAEIAAKHVEESPPAPKEFVPGLPDSLNSITLRCLAKLPTSRFQDARELLAALDVLATHDYHATSHLKTFEKSEAKSVDGGGQHTRPVDSPESPTTPDDVHDPLPGPPPGGSVAITLEPAEATGRIFHRYSVGIATIEPATARLNLVAGDDGGRVRTRLRPETIVITPDHAARSSLIVWAWPHFTREPVRHSFDVRAASAAGLHGSSTGHFVQPPVAYGWMPFAAGGALLTLLVCMLGIAGLSAFTSLLPFGASADPNDHFYISDLGNRVHRYDASGGLSSSWGGTGSAERQFNAPAGMAVDADGNILVADRENDRIQKLSPDGDLLAVWGVSGAGPGEFDQPSDVGIGPEKRVYVVDRGNHRVQVFDADGAFIDEYGGQGSADGMFNFPQAIAFDPVGNFYVTDTGNSRVQKLQSFGAFLLAWGAEGAADGEFSEPLGIAVDQDGNVYIADSGNARVQKFDFDGGYIDAWHSDDDGQLLFERPVGIAVQADRIYVIDEAASRVSVLNLSGRLVGLWETAGALDRPQGIAAVP